MMRLVEGGYLFINSQERIDGRLRRSDRVLDGENDVVWDLTVLPDECNIGRAHRPDQRTIALHSRHKLTGDERHHARGRRCR